MSWDRNHNLTATVGFNLNMTTALGTVDGDVKAALHEFKVFNIAVTFLALCVITFAGVYCSVSCFYRRRQSQRAHVYESAVSREDPVDPVDIRAVKRSTSFRNPLALFRKQEGPSDNSRIYYIYCNPLPVGLEDEENSAPSGLEEQDLVPIRELTIEDYAMDPTSGIILDPPNFYMQL